MDDCHQRAVARSRRSRRGNQQAIILEVHDDGQEQTDDAEGDEQQLGRPRGHVLVTHDVSFSMVANDVWCVVPV
jgi:hypothetical protein